MLPPALGGPRVLRAAVPGPSSAREYRKDQARHRGDFARPSTEHVNYSKKNLANRKGGVLKIYVLVQLSMMNVI